MWKDTSIFEASQLACVFNNLLMIWGYDFIKYTRHNPFAIQRWVDKSFNNIKKINLG
jgi:hypothetical protein